MSLTSTLVDFELAIVAIDKPQNPNATFHIYFTWTSQEGSSYRVNSAFRAKNEASCGSLAGLRAMYLKFENLSFTV